VVNNRPPANHPPSERHRASGDKHPRNQCWLANERFKSRKYILVFSPTFSFTSSASSDEFEPQMVHLRKKETSKEALALITFPWFLANQTPLPRMGLPHHLSLIPQMVVLNHKSEINDLIKSFHLASTFIGCPDSH